MQVKLLIELIIVGYSMNIGRYASAITSGMVNGEIVSYI